MKKHNLQTGKIGEEIAKDYLKKSGDSIIEQNYKTKFGEIDLVVNNSAELIFVEVRTKIGENFGTPEESLDKRKLKKLWWNASSYAFRKKWQKPCRIDAICIVLKPNYAVERINHYKNIIA